MTERNYRIIGNGQEMWGHVCTKCMVIIDQPDGTQSTFYSHIMRSCTYTTTILEVITAGCCDGVTCGHPCCSFRPVCMEPLQSSKHRFCASHFHLRRVCYITGCSAAAEDDHLTCNDSTHRAEEDRVQGLGPTAMSQLRARAARTGNTTSETTTTHTRDRPRAATTTASGTTNMSDLPRPKGTMARRWTHCEQLFVRCCGVILARATFYNAEGVPGVKVGFRCMFRVL